MAVDRFKKLMRKVIPLRASVFESYRKKQGKQFADVALALARVEDCLGQIQKQNRSLIDAIGDLEQKVDVQLPDQLIGEIERGIRRAEHATESLLDDELKALRDEVLFRSVGVSVDLKTIEARVSGLQKMMVESAGEKRDRAFRVCDNVPPLPMLSEEDDDVVVSLTTYPARILTVHRVVESLLNQTVLPDKIELWLAADQFPYLEEELPDKLLGLRNGTFSIKWCDDLKAHKKYFYSMQCNPRSLIVTVDDDMEYAPDTLEELLRAHERFPEAVCARRVRQIVFDNNGDAAPYRSWPLVCMVGEPRDDLVATGVGGVLYPPGCMDPLVFDKELIMRLCPHSDDLWLKTMQIIKGTMTVMSDAGFRACPIEGTQETSLYLVDASSNRNDRDVRAIREALVSLHPSIWHA